MKNRIIIGLLVLLVVSTGDLFAALAQKPVGVPLDGGLLTILGAAGIAYYIGRKKKQADQS